MKNTNYYKFTIIFFIIIYCSYINFVESQHTYKVSGTFDDGGIFSGYFTYDASNDVYSNVSISVSGGATTYFPPYTYVTDGLAGYEYDYELNLSTDNYRNLYLYYDPMLSNNPVTSTITTESNEYNFTQTATDKTRYVVSGTAIPQNIINPSSAVSISISNSISNAISASTSISNTLSISVSSSVSNTNSISNTLSSTKSTSISNNISISNSISNTLPISNSNIMLSGINPSNSINLSISMSNVISPSISISISYNQTVSLSVSVNISNTVSTTLSNSISNTNSYSMSNSILNTISVSNYPYGFLSVSASNKKSESNTIQSSLFNTLTYSNSISNNNKVLNTDNNKISNTNSLSYYQSNTLSSKITNSISFSISNSISTESSIKNNNCFNCPNKCGKNKLANKLCVLAGGKYMESEDIYCCENPNLKLEKPYCWKIKKAIKLHKICGAIKGNLYNENNKTCCSN